MHTEPRNGASIDRIYIHTNEGPEQAGGAIGLAHYLESNGPQGGGYHIVDGDVLVRLVGDDIVVWGAGGDNEHTLHIVLEGYAAQTPQQWADAFSTGELGRAVQQVATWCKQYNIPVVRVRPGAPGQPPTDRGIAEHADDHSPYSQGHTDPGTGLPIDAFIKLVAAVVSPPVDWAALAKLAAWEKAVAAKPLEYKQDRPEVVILKQLLERRGYHVEPGTVYGDFVSRAVAQFKAKAKLTNRIGEIVGADCAHALLSAPQ